MEKPFDQQALMEHTYLEIGDTRLGIGYLARLLRAKPGTVRLVRELGCGKQIVATNEQDCDEYPCLELELCLNDGSSSPIPVARLELGEDKQPTGWLYDHNIDTPVVKLAVDARSDAEVEANPVCPQLEVYGERHLPTMCRIDEGDVKIR